MDSVDAASLHADPFFDGVLTAVGNTPLVRLSRILPSKEIDVYAKLEMANPGGSGKDRSALGMLLDGVHNRSVGPSTTIIESSSGNLGVGLAQACCYLRLRFVCVVDSRTTPNHIALLKLFGAEVEVVKDPHPVCGGLLAARLRRVRDLRRTIPDNYWIHQHANTSNPRAQYQLFGEIHQRVGDSWDYVLIAAGTCGTLRAARDYVREHQLKTKIVAVDAVGSVIFGSCGGQRLIPGHGASRRPELYEKGLEDFCVRVTDRDCVEGCFQLLRREAILAGGSSGAVVTALKRVSSAIAPGSTVVLVLCDRGDRYLDTVFSRSWVEAHFGMEFQPWSDS